MARAAAIISFNEPNGALGIRDDHRRRFGELRDRDEILARVVTRVLVDQRIDVVAVRRLEQRIAVRGRFGDVRRSDVAAGARAVFNHDLPAEIARELLGDDAPDHIEAAAGRVTDDELHRLRRVLGGRLRHHFGSDTREQKRGEVCRTHAP